MCSLGGECMKSKHRNAIAAMMGVLVFLARLVRGLCVPRQEPGFIPSGAMNEPSVVVVSAVLAGVLTYILLQALFWAGSNLKKK